MLRNTKLSTKATRLFRSFSTQLSRKEESSPFSTTKLPNGLTVVSQEGNNANANVCLLVKAGSRYEDQAMNLGVSHCLRAAACLTSDKNTAFLTTQLLGSVGGNVEVSGTREHISYNLTCGGKIWQNLFQDVVVPTLFGGRFFWWEISDLSKVMKFQVAQAQNDEVFRLIEAAHSASFSGGLSNSVLCPEAMIGSHTSEMVQDFFNSRYHLNNMVLAGNGVIHQQLCDIASTIVSPHQGHDVKLSPSKFIASEVRQFQPGDFTHVGLSFPGTSLNDQDTIAVAVLQNILGTNIGVTRGKGFANRLPRAVQQKVDSQFTISSFNVNYSDSGILGVYMKAVSKDIEGVLRAASAELDAIASGNISDEEVNAGKLNLKANLLLDSEDTKLLLNDVAVQTSVLGSSITALDIASKINAITTSQVARVAKKILGGKKSLAVIGNTSSCPYLHDL